MAKQPAVPDAEGGISRDDLIAAVAKRTKGSKDAPITKENVEQVVDATIAVLGESGTFVQHVGAELPDAQTEPGETLEPQSRPGEEPAGDGL